MQQNVAALIQERQNKFIETRTIIEQEVNKFIESLSKLDDGTKARIGGVPDGVTAKTLLPSMWAEPFDEAKYQQERAALDEYIGKVIQIGDAINREALECLRL